MAGRDLWVGSPGGSYPSLGEALAASRDGDVIHIRPGVYVNDFGTVAHRVSIVADGGPVRLEATRPIPNGKAILIVRNDATIDGLTFAGARVADHNGAGIRYEGGALTIRNCIFADNENGLLAGAVPGGTVSVERSEFARNGGGDGYTHGLYVGLIERLRVVDSYFHDTAVGHHIKSRARETVIESSRLDDGVGGTASYSIDLPNGGVATIRANTIVQSATGKDPAMIAYGAEGTPPPGSSLTIVANRFENDLANGVGVRNFSRIVAEIRDNVLVDLPTLAVGRSHQSGNTLGQRSLSLPSDLAPEDPAIQSAADSPDSAAGPGGGSAEIALVGVSGGSEGAGDLGND